MKNTILLITLFFAGHVFAQEGKCVKGNCITGIGKMVYPGVDSGRYEGGFVNGKRSGKGTFEDIWQIYTGEWKNDRYDGQGKKAMKTTFKSKGKYSEEYSGGFKDGLYSGEGLWVYYIETDSNMVYKGNFKAGQYFGKGTLRIGRMGGVRSESWTDNKNFTSGEDFSQDNKNIRYGSYVNNNFEEKSLSANRSTQSGGSGFKTLNFHKANSTILKRNIMVDELVSSLSSAKTGTININTQTGTITISAGSDADKVYKIVSVGSETKDQYDNKTITITCTDDSGMSCTATIKKQYAYVSSNEMWFNITYANGTGKGYLCDLLSNVYQN